MNLSSSRILTASSLSNGIIIPSISSTQKNLINPLQIGDTSLQRLRTITTTPVIKSTTVSTTPKPTIYILNNNSMIKSEPQEPITINRLLLSNNNPNLATFVNSLLQSTPTQNSISKLLETPINVVQQPTIPQHRKYSILSFSFKFFFLSFSRK